MSRIVVLDNTKRYTKDNMPKHKKGNIPKLIDEALKIGLSHLLQLLIPILGPFKM